MKRSDLSTLPNLLTWSRILAVPFILLFTYFDTLMGNLLAASIFGLASLTDLVDGVIARRFGLSTNFGKLLDPLADKLITIPTLVFMVGQGRMAVEMDGESVWLLGVLLAVISITRAFLITGLRAIAASEGIVIAAKRQGKVKAALEYIAIILFLLATPHSPFGANFESAGLITFALSTFFSVTSAVDYVREFYRGIPKQ